MEKWANKVVSEEPSRRESRGGPASTMLDMYGTFTTPQFPFKYKMLNQVQSSNLHLSKNGHFMLSQIHSLVPQTLVPKLQFYWHTMHIQLLVWFVSLFYFVLLCPWFQRYPPTQLEMPVKGMRPVSSDTRLGCENLSLITWRIKIQAQLQKTLFYCIPQTPVHSSYLCPQEQ